jgi:nitrogen fixation/metabolism regulation signal transduction histidine kinase
VTLRARLFLALLLLALLPTTLVTLFTLAQLDRATRRWFSPGVENALESGEDLSRSGLARLDGVVRAAADRWAERMRTRAPARPGRGDAGEAERREVGASGLDFVQIYRLEPDRWRLDRTIAAEKVLLVDSLDLSGEIPAALDGARILHSKGGALAGVARTGPSQAVVAGMRLDPDFYDRLLALDQGLGYYRRLSVLVDVQRRWVWVLVLVLVAVVLLGAALLADAIARETARPLAELSAGLERVAAGELESRVHPRGARELRALGAAFNLTAERLAAAREGLRRAEREAAWRDAARRLAHEIKNPLTPMRLSLHRLQKRVDQVPAAERGAVEESLTALLHEVEQLAHLAEQFSQYARLPEPRLAPMDLGATARDAASLHGQGAAEVRFVADGALPVRGDPTLLSRAVGNLILNACEASPAGAAVEVHARSEGGEAVVEVLDRGPGVDESVRGRVFEPYVSTKARGSGLGLSLVRDIAVQHGGRVTLESRDQGGARARFVLPLAGAGGTTEEGG